MPRHVFPFLHIRRDSLTALVRHQDVNIATHPQQRTRIHQRIALAFQQDALETRGAQFVEHLHAHTVHEFVLVLYLLDKAHPFHQHPQRHLQFLLPLLYAGVYHARDALTAGDVYHLHPVNAPDARRKGLVVMQTVL